MSQLNEESIHHGPSLADLAELQLYQCPQCPAKFKKLGHYNRHLNERHSNNRAYICTEQNCGKTFKRGSHLKRHMISHSNIKQFKCPLCIMSFGYKHHLDRHVKLIHLRERLECHECQLKFIKKKAFNKHMSKHHSETNQQSEQTEEKKGQLLTKTMSKVEDRPREDDIYESSEESGEGDMVESQKDMFRCIHQSCMSAFYGLYEFKRHMTTIHSE